MRTLPLVQNLKDLGLLDAGFDTAKAASISFEPGSVSCDEDSLKERLFALANTVNGSMADGRLTFYEIFSVGVAFVRILRTQEKTSVPSSDVPKRKSKRKA
jgi:hypothetical protein